MHVVITARDWPKIMLRIIVADQETTQGLIDKFCEVYCLPSQTCSLFDQGVELHDQPICRVRLQKGKALELLAVFQVSATFYTYYHLEAPSGGSRPAALQSEWCAAAKRLNLLHSTDPEYPPQSLQLNMAKVQAVDLIPIIMRGRQYMEDSKLMTMDIITLALVVKRLASFVMEGTSVTQNDSQTPSLSISKSSAADTNTLVSQMTSCFVLLKLISLSSRVRTNLPVSPAMTAMWSVVKETLPAIKVTPDSSNAGSQPNSSTSGASDAEIQHLACDLVDLLADLQSLIVGRGNLDSWGCERLDICWRMLCALMTICPSPVAERFVAQGALWHPRAAIRNQTLFATAHSLIFDLLNLHELSRRHITQVATFFKTTSTILQYGEMLSPISVEPASGASKGDSKESYDLDLALQVSQTMNIILEQADSAADVTPKEWQSLNHVTLNAAILARSLDLALTKGSANAIADADLEVRQVTERCQWSVQRLLFNLLISQVNDPELDVTEVVHAAMEPILHAWDPASEELMDSGMLAIAVLKRAAEDPAIFLSQPQAGEAEALLRAVCQKLGALERGQSIAALTLSKALFAAVERLVWATCFLTLHKESSAFKPKTNTAKLNPQRVVDFAVLMDKFKSHVPTVMTLAACFFNLCLTDFQQLSVVDTAKSLPRHLYSDAVATKFFEDIITDMLHGITAPLPWATEQTVSVARALEMCSRLCTTPGMVLGSMICTFIQEKKKLLPTLHQHLQRIDLVTADMRLQQQFLIASHGMLCPIYAMAKPEGLAMTLMDLLVKYKPANADQAASSRQLLHSQIVPIGLSGLQPLELQSRVLHAILECIKAKKDWMHLALYVVPVCVEQLAAYASFCMESYNHKKVPVKNLPDLRPYFRMFADYQTALGKSQKLNPPSGAPKALMQFLYLFINRLEHMCVYSRHPTMPQADRCWCTTQLEQSKQSVMILLDTMGVLYEHEAWALAWHYLGPFTWCKDKKASAQLNRWLLSLLDDKILTESTVVKIKNYAQAKLDKNFAEALASEAAAQLLAEEDKAAAKAASKKAKKQRQKQAKQAVQSLAAAPATLNADQPQQQDDTDHAEAFDEQFADEFQQSLMVTQELQTHSQAATQSQTYMPAVSQAGDTSHAQSEGTANAVSRQHEQPQHADLSSGVEGDAAEAAGEMQQAASQPDDAAAPMNRHFLQSLFCCPITQAMMTDPVIAADGRTYERAAMAEWLQHHNTSPVTGCPLPHKRLVPNLAAKSAIAANLS